MEERGAAWEGKRIALLALIMAMVAMVVGGLILALLYRAAFDKECDFLIEEARSQAALMEATAGSGNRYGLDSPPAVRAAAMGRIIEAQRRHRDLGAIRELSIVRRDGARIGFLLYLHARESLPHALSFPPPLPWESPAAEPMRRVLEGRSGTWRGADVQGVQVLTAFQPIPDLGLGVVVARDLAEVRRPFFQAAASAAASALIVIILGVVLFFRLSGPILRGAKTRQETLIRQREFTNAVLQHMVDGVAACDAEGRITLFSRALREYYGPPPDDSVPPEEWARFYRHFDADGDTPLPADQVPLLRVLRGETVENVEVVIETAAGERRHLVTSGRAMFDARGEKIGAVISTHDITQRKQAERERQRLRAQAIHSARLASLGELSANVAHEINNPNNAIQFNIGLMMRIWRDAVRLLQEVPEVCEEAGAIRLGGLPLPRAIEQAPLLLEGIQGGSQRIAAIIANLKNMARRDAGALSPGVDLGAVIQSALMILHSRIVRQTDRLETALMDNTPSVTGNAQQLEQLFINLIQNALQALPDRTRGVRIEMGVDPHGAQIRVTIRDQGAGIDPSIVDRITEPFFTTRLESGGTGLGLSICAAILETHHGTIDFDSQPGRGTAVTVTLPIAPPSDPASRPRSPTP